MIALFVILGLIVGSFLNVVVYRLPLRQSLISPASACPSCSTPIRSYDNIPVLSWLLLNGRCRSCHSKITIRYPIVEIGTGLFFGLVVWKFLLDDLLLTVAFLFLAALSVVLGLIDWDTHTLPDRVVLPSYLVGFVILGGSTVTSGNVAALVRASVGMSALWLLYLIVALLSSGGIGYGDVKFAGLIGLFLGYLGWGALVTGAFAAFILGGSYGLALVASRKASRKSGIPFGPWMLAGAWVGIFLGQPIVQSYLSIFGLNTHA